ncbi:MAG: caspase family protein [Methylococcales bacterium]|nr:caspase family protein [Methylococcales bacterium]
MRRTFIISLFLFFYLITSAQSKPRLRTALVIGNSTYQAGPLDNPVNDANDMAAKLKELGFEVILKLNASKREMKDAVRLFDTKLRNKRGVGLFYYAGHGMQIKGANYLIPVDANIKESYDVADESLEASYVLDAMEASGNELSIVILDACRDNPFARSWRSSKRGLAKMNAATGSIIAYATAPGNTAADGIGRNGLYTKYLLKNMSKPDLSIEEVFKNVRISVTKESNKLQTPWEESSLMGSFQFLKPSTSLMTNKPSATVTTKSSKVKKLKKNSISSHQEAVSLNLRTNGMMLSSSDVKASLVKHGFYDKRWNLNGKGVDNRYEAQVKNNVIVIYDATTGLTWQKGGAPTAMTLEKAQQYVKDMNVKKLAGFDNWRLPTVDEALSLMEKEVQNEFHISPEFEYKINFIWTADRSKEGRIWMAYFYHGFVDLEHHKFNARVKLVR